MPCPRVLQSDCPAFVAPTSSIHCTMLSSGLPAVHASIYKRVGTRRLLWLLSTRLGTLLLCGPACITRDLPYVQRFADLPPRRAERVMRRWFRAWLHWKRLAARVVHATTLSAIAGEACAMLSTMPVTAFAAQPNSFCLIRCCEQMVRACAAECRQYTYHLSWQMSACIELTMRPQLESAQRHQGLCKRSGTFRYPSIAPAPCALPGQPEQHQHAFLHRA